jgi:hypothetical protein
MGFATIEEMILPVGIPISPLLTSTNQSTQSATMHQIKTKFSLSKTRMETSPYGYSIILRLKNKHYLKGSAALSVPVPVLTFN